MTPSNLLGNFLRNLSESNNHADLLFVDDNAKTSSTPKKRRSIRRFHSQPICSRSKLLAAKEVSRWEPCPFLSPFSSDEPLSFPERGKEEQLERSCVGRNRSDSILLQAPKHYYEMESLPVLSVIHQSNSSLNSICLEAEKITLDNPKSGMANNNYEKVEQEDFSSTLSIFDGFYNLVKLFELMIMLILSSISRSGSWLMITKSQFTERENDNKVASTQNEDRDEKSIESNLEEGSWEPFLIL